MTSLPAARRVLQCFDRFLDRAFHQPGQGQDVALQIVEVAVEMFRHVPDAFRGRGADRAEPVRKRPV